MGNPQTEKQLYHRSFGTGVKFTGLCSVPARGSDNRRRSSPRESGFEEHQGLIAGIPQDWGIQKLKPLKNTYKGISSTLPGPRGKKTPNLTNNQGNGN